MNLWRAFGWSLLIFVILTLIATAAWLIAGDSSLEIGATAALVAVISVALYLGYRLIKSGSVRLMGFVAAVICGIPAVIVGWGVCFTLRVEFGKTVGPIPVEKFAKMKEREAVLYRLRGRMIWNRGVKLRLGQHNEEKQRFNALPFVPVSWKPGDPIHVWALGTQHRYKTHDFDACKYPSPDPCVLTLFPPRQGGLRLLMIRKGGVGPKRGGSDFIVLRADNDPLWLSRRLALFLGGGWVLLFGLWLWWLGRRAGQLEAAGAPV